MVAAIIVQRELRARAPSVNAPSPSASASSTAAPAVTRIIDLPPPPTNVPAAGAEYASGIQAIHDDNWIMATEHFQKAVDLDPSMAAAHLRLSMTNAAGDRAVRRAEFETTAGLRSQLSPRDQALMLALQPFLQGATQDIPETDRRLQALIPRYPTDVELLMWLGLIHMDAPENLPTAERALALDPEDAQSWEIKGRALLTAGNVLDARDAFERCSKLSVDGADCFAYLSVADSLAGRCADFEADARRAADREASYGIFVLRAMVSAGARADAIDETLKQIVPRIPKYLGPELQRAAIQTQLAIVAGDFAHASVLAKAEDTLRRADPHLEPVYAFHYEHAVQEIQIDLEVGDATAAQHAAAGFVARSDAWATQATDDTDLSLYFARLSYSTRESPPAEFETRRRAWIDARVAAGAYLGRIWSYAYAATALTESEAHAALDVRPRFGMSPGTPAGIFVGSPDAELGRINLLSGNVDEAIVPLKRAVAACDLYDAPVEHVRAALDLGRALEKKGDPAGACEAYGKVLAQWGNAKPRSVTADAAGARVKALACKP